MYDAECNNVTVNILDIHSQMLQQQQEVTPNPMKQSYFDTIIKWFESLIGLTHFWNKKNVL